MKKNRAIGFGYCVAMAIHVVACGSQGSDESGADSVPATPLIDRLKALDHDLSLGSQGEDVRAVNEYLTKFGYFPNAELERSFTAWRPIVASAPADPLVYDEHMVDAIRAQQFRAGLPVTGVVDAKLRELMLMRRCGVPDGLARRDPSEKYAIGNRGFYPPGSVVAWHLDTAGAPAGAAAAIAAAFATWGGETGLNFQQSFGPLGNIPIRFRPIDGAGNVFGQTHLPADGGDITMDSAESWKTSQQAGSIYLQMAVLHEIGHALGLMHSSINYAEPTAPFIVMNTFFGEVVGLLQDLSTDDKVAISVLSDTWLPVPGELASDVAISPVNGAIWKIGRNGSTGDQQISKWNGSGWTPTTTGKAVAIAVSKTDIPWVVDSAGTICRRTSSSPTSGGWDCSVTAGVPARDITSSPEGSIWIVGKASVDSAGNGNLYVWNGSGWSKIKTGAANRIAVGPMNIAWVVNKAGNIFRQSTELDPTVRTWGLLPGLAQDIAVSPDILKDYYPDPLSATANGYAWIIGTGAIGSNFGVFVWDEQTQQGPVGGASSSPGARGWLQAQSASGSRIAAGPHGRGMIIDNTGRIWIPAGS